MVKRLRGNELILIGTSIVGASAFAIEPSQLLLIQKGPTVLKPQFQFTEIFNDNVTYDDTGKKADLITVVSPGAVFQLGSKDFNHLSLSYFFDRLQYINNSDLSANQHHLATTVHFTHSRLTLDGGDKIEFLSSPLGGGISVGGQLVDRTFLPTGIAFRMTFLKKPVSTFRVRIISATIRTMSLFTINERFRAHLVFNTKHYHEPIFSVRPITA